jgi:hypothetical protein
LQEVIYANSKLFYVLGKRLERETDFDGKNTVMGFPAATRQGLVKATLASSQLSPSACLSVCLLRPHLDATKACWELSKIDLLDLNGLQQTLALQEKKIISK